MTSEDESDGETSDSTSPDATPIMMARRVDKKRVLTSELPIKTNTECAASKDAAVGVTTDSANTGISATGAPCMSL